MFIKPLSSCYGSSESTSTLFLFKTIDFYKITFFHIPLDKTRENEFQSSFDHAYEGDLDRISNVFLKIYFYHREKKITPRKKETSILGVPFLPVCANFRNPYRPGGKIFLRAEKKIDHARLLRNPAAAWSGDSLGVAQQLGFCIFVYQRAAC